MVITTDEYLLGLGCSKAVYTHKQWQVPTTVAPQNQELTDLAKDFFAPASHTMSPTDDSHDLWARLTARFLEKKGEVSCAVFMADGCLAMSDIVRKTDNGLHITCIRETTQLSEIDVYAASFIYYVIAASGYKIQKFSLAHLNKEYVKDGDITSEIFVVRDLTKPIQKMQKLAKTKIDRIKGVLGFAIAPDVEIGMHCFSPKPCQYNCWDLPSNNVFDLDMSIKKKFRLYYKEIITVEEAINSYLTDEEQLQAHCIIKHKIGIQKALREWIDKAIIKERVSFLYVNTEAHAIPRYDGLKPWALMPVDINIVGKVLGSDDAENTELGVDIGSIEKMLNYFEKDNSPIVMFEASQVKALKNLQKPLKLDSKRMAKLLSRVVILSEVFEQKLYYDPRYKGDMSFQNVCWIMGNDTTVKAQALLQIFEVIYDSLIIAEKSNGFN